MEVLEGLTPELQSAVIKFCSHPTADALRRTITSWKEYSFLLPASQTYPDANTFYMYHFTLKKVAEAMIAIERIQDLTGADVKVHEYAVRPKLWPLYDKAFPNYFENHPPLFDHTFRDDEWMSEVEDLETNYYTN